MKDAHKEFNKIILPIVRDLNVKWCRTYSESYKNFNTTKLYCVRGNTREEVMQTVEKIDYALSMKYGYVNTKCVLKPYCTKVWSILIHSR